MRKLLVAALAVICLTCIAVVAGCGEVEPNYYILTWVTPNGISIDTSLPEDYEVKEGAVVSFSVVKTGVEEEYIYDSDNTSKAIIVKANNSTLTANEEGQYSITMSSNTRVVVSGLYLPADYEVTFGSTDEYRISYNLISPDETIDSETNGIIVRQGTEIKFSLNISSYYGESSYTVLHNTQIVSPDEFGVYSITVNENKNITVQGLQPEANFIARGDGTGTAADPFLLKRPIDLYAMASYINDSWYTQFYNCYYRLENDIDMGGEQLFIIGDYIASQTAIFAGDFDGNGHTISNYYIEDTIIDQETYTPLFIPNIGMFGYAAATTAGPVNIYNLTLSDFRIVVDGANSANTTAYVGSIVGAGIGVNITGCTVKNGEIVVAGDDNYPSFVGGLIGYQQSAYMSETVRFLSSVVSSSSEDVSIRVNGGFVYAVGGISGYVVTSQESTPSYIINSFTNGSSISATNASGVSLLNAGGIAGMMTDYGVIENCYTVDSRLVARSSLSRVDGYYYHLASAGGIVGFAYGDTLIANSFVSGNNLTATASSDRYANTDSYAGYLMKNNLAYVSSIPARVINCLDTGITNAAIQSDLGWGTADWVFGSGYPTINKANTSKTITLTLVAGTGHTFDGKESITITIENTYLPLSYIYLYDDDFKMTEYVTTDGGLRSYGYFFDNQLGERISNSFIPIDNMTFYVGVADYDQVIGQYYVNPYTYVLLHNNGVYTYCSNSMIFNAGYIYDGETITLYSCPLFTTEDGFVSALAVKTDNGLSIYENDTYTAASPMVGYATIANLQYGEYYDANGGIYTFNADRTVTYLASSTSAVVSYNYTITGGNLQAGANTICTVVDGVITTFGSTLITKFDDYKGTWESEATLNQEFTFDGKGEWSAVKYEYVEGERVEVKNSALSGTYTVDGNNKLTLSVSGVNIGSAEFDTTYGYLHITVYGEEPESDSTLTFYRESSFVGTWTFPSRSNEPVSLVILGIGLDGIGSAEARYDVNDAHFNLTYEVSDDELTFYYFGTIFGVLEFNTANLTLSGQFYSVSADQVAAGRVFFLTDSFYGTWFSDSSSSTLYFNGSGLYDVNSTSVHMAVRSSVSLDGHTSRRYTLENGNMYGTFTDLGVNYTIEYFEDSDKMLLTRVNADNSEVKVWYHRADAMHNMRLYSSTTTSSSTYTFDGNGTLTVVTNTPTATPATSTVTYKYSILSNGNIELTVSENVVGTITVTRSTNATTNVTTITYSLQMVGGAAIALSTTASQV